MVDNFNKLLYNKRTIRKEFFINLITIGRASKISGSPSRQALHKLSKKEDKPKFFIFETGKYKVDVDCIEWKNYLQKNNGIKIIENKIKKGIFKGESSIEKKDVEFCDKLSGGKLDDYLKNEIDLNRRKGGGGRDAEKNISDASSSTGEKTPDQVVREYYEGQEKKYGMSIAEATILEQVGKAEKVQEEVLLKRFQRKEKEKKLIDVEMGMFLFCGFLERINSELSLIPHKIMPQLESLILSKQSKQAEKLMLREFESSMKLITKEQAVELENWKEDKG